MEGGAGGQTKLQKGVNGSYGMRASTALSNSAGGNPEVPRVTKGGASVGPLVGLNGVPMGPEKLPMKDSEVLGFVVQFQ